MVLPKNALYLLSFGIGHSIYCCWKTFSFDEEVKTFAGQSDFQSYADALWWGVVSFLGGENQANLFFVHIPDGENQANIFSFSLLNVVVLFPQYIFPSDHGDNDWLWRHSSPDLDGQDCSILFLRLYFCIFCFLFIFFSFWTDCIFFLETWLSLILFHMAGPQKYFEYLFPVSPLRDE